MRMPKVERFIYSKFLFLYFKKESLALLVDDK